MTKRMLIDATHPEETRVAVVNGNKLEEYDFETISRKQLKGNIYLVKVTRVEPSLQAAFVDFGGNRHGFLPFPEIHPDYYRIPIADREAILEEERRLAREQEEAEDAEDDDVEISGEDAEDDDVPSDIVEVVECEGSDEAATDVFETPSMEDKKVIAQQQLRETITEYEIYEGDRETSEASAETEENSECECEACSEEDDDNEQKFHEEAVDLGETTVLDKDLSVDEVSEDSSEVEVVGKKPFSRLKKYKIQEVIKRNQIMLIQIAKEERGNKGAAVTSYISLPGRYCVLMPNSPRGGGVSRKVSNIKDRQRLKKILKNMNVPEGMSVILRTAAILRSEAEIRRDLEYLLRLWDQIRELTLKSTAPAMIYEEGNLIKRSIRDLFKNDIEEIQVAGERGFNIAKDFTNTLAPSGLDKVKMYKDEFIPLFTRYQVESQINEIHNTNVYLKSGGYIVINPTEALVAIDVNSGKSTKSHHIEETAVKTNIEAAEEIARQLRLRDQGGLVVIDFIDMEEPKNNRLVERKLREAMQNDRARIQMGRMSPFGLMELSRQRLNPSLVETNFEICPHCQGRGLIRTLETSGIMVLRAIEEEGTRQRADELHVKLPTEVAIYLLNHKREALKKIEDKYEMIVYLNADEKMEKPNYEIEVVQAAKPEKSKKRTPIQTVDMSDFVMEEPAKEITVGGNASIDDDDASNGESNVVELIDEDNDGKTTRNTNQRSRRRGSRGGKNRGRSRNNNRNSDGTPNNNNNSRNNNRRYNNKKEGDQQPSTANREEPKVASQDNSSEASKGKRKGWWSKILSS